MKSKFVKIYGRVQGVGFRSWTKKKAEEFSSITGSKIVKTVQLNARFVESKEY